MDAISYQTFTNCFRKSGIVQNDTEKAMNDEEDPFKRVRRQGYRRKSSPDSGY